MASMPFLSCKFFASQKTYETIVPASLPAIRGGVRHWILPVAKSIYPPLADSNGNSGILPPPFGRTPASMPFLSFGFCEAKPGKLLTPASAAHTAAHRPPPFIGYCSFYCAPGVCYIGW
jgi:hypothetical protein